METALLMLDALSVMVLVFTSLRNDRLRSDQPLSGPFRYAVDQARDRTDRPAVPARSQPSRR